MTWTPRHGWPRCVLFIVQFVCAVVAAVGVILLLAGMH